MRRRAAQRKLKARITKQPDRRGSKAAAGAKPAAKAKKAPAAKK